MSLQQTLRQWRLKRLFAKHRIDLYEEMAEAMDDGEAMEMFVRKKKERSAARGKPVAEVYAKWQSRMQRSGSFAEAIKSFVPSLDYLVVRSAEKAGKLAEGLRFLAQVIFKWQAMAKSLRKAVAMPSVIMAFVITLVVMFAKFVVPVFVDILPPEKWPASGRAFYTVSQVLFNYGVFFAATLIALVGFFVWSLDNWTGPARDKLDNYLPYSVYRDYSGAIFLVIFASLMKAGVAQAEALQLIKETSHPWLARHVSRILYRMERESSSVYAINTGVLPEDLAYRVIDYGERSGLREAIERIGFRAIDIVQEKVMASSKVINGFALFIGGSSLGFIIFAMMMTGYSIAMSFSSYKF